MAMDNRLIILIAVVAIAAFAFNFISPGSIVVPGAGAGAAAYQGSTLTWTAHIDSATGAKLAEQMGCANLGGYVAVPVTYKTQFLCKPSQYGYADVTSTDPTTATIFSCNHFYNNPSAPAIDMVGQSSAVIPENTITGAGGCSIVVDYYATYNGKQYSIRDQASPLGYLINVLQKPAQACTNGATTCINSQSMATCVNGIYTNAVTCPSFCSNSVCAASCTPGQIKCNGNANYQLCGQNSQWGGMVSLLNTGTTCINNQIVGSNPSVVCPDGSQAASAAQCPAYCGDGACNGGETQSSCSKDCQPSQPPTQNTTTNQTIVGNQTQNTTQGGTGTQGGTTQQEQQNSQNTLALVGLIIGAFVVWKVFFKG